MPQPEVRALLFVSLLATFGCREAPLPPPAPPPAVTVARAVKANGLRELRLSGTLSAERSIAVGFATLGTVERVFVEEGQAVARGQLLATLSDRSYRDAVGIAEAKAR